DGGGDAEVIDFPEIRARRFPTLWQTFAACAVVSLLALLMVRPTGEAKTFAVMKKTESARWESGSLPTADGARLGAGDLELVRGLATIRFDSGAEVVLEAPARITLVDAMNCVLERGTVVAEIEPTAAGFTVRTPTARVIDHGTRFAVNVDPADGATQTQVFDGHVEVELPETRKRIALREGQRNLVAGETLGGASTGPEEGTWSRPEAPSAPREAGLRRITTADPGGADIYVDARNPNPLSPAAKAAPIDPHISETLLLVKNALGTMDGAPHRKAYLRFPLSGIAPGSISEARLELHFTPTGWGLASNLGNAEFTVYGALGDASDDWTSDQLDWTNAPASDTGSGNGMDSTKVRLLGRFTVPRGIQSGSFGIRGEALRDFLNADPDRSATLIVVRETMETRGGGLVHAFASSRHPTLPPPTLHVKTGPLVTHDP
ncbi:MAG TPA: FecR domain-containing protein, partial [Bacteroidia bacterium]|nr:FecR domain-containing protein [Bacteroidia bacterium]